MCLISDECGTFSCLMLDWKLVSEWGLCGRMNLRKEGSECMLVLWVM